MHNIRYLLLVVILALAAMISLHFINKESPEAVFTPETPTLRQPVLPKVPLTQPSKSLILKRVDDPAPLSDEEKEIIIKQFSGKTPVPLTEAERRKINNALEK